MQALIGARIGDYKIEAEIGRGAMGVVYRARQFSLDRPVALKVLSPLLAADASFVERFKREATIAATLDHPSIVRVYEAGAHLDLDTGERLHYFAMQYIEGETAHDRLQREGRLPFDEAVAIAVHIAQALDYAWRKARLIHRDIKPSNIFLSTNGEVKLGDLGLARSAGDSEGGAGLTATGGIVGTAHFMSPEQARGERGLDFRSDIYGLGCTLYRMLCGRHLYEGPFASVIAQHLTEPPPNLRMVLPDCPVELARLIEKMLAKHLSGRQQSYDESITELRRVHEQITSGAVEGGSRSPSASSSVVLPLPTPSRKQLPTILYTIMGTTTVILLAGALLWAPWKQSEQPPSNSEAVKARTAPVTQTLLSAAAESPKEQPKPASEAQAENVGGASAPRPAQAENRTLARSATEQSRGAEAAPAFQQPVAERASVQQSAQPPADGTPARSATNAAVIQVAQAAPPPTPAAQPSAPQPADEAFVKSVAAMQPEQQVQAVIAKLKELNPNFDGKETHKIEGGAVTTLSFSTVGVSDISPVKALRWLRTLSMTPPTLNQKGSLENLAPLQGMQLTWLWCHNNPISDLSPLKGMPLTTLSFGGTQVSDLSPLTGMKLQVLSFNDTVVSDTATLEGMPLTVLWCNNTKLSDLSPVKAAPLREIKCDFVAERDAAILRGIRTLSKINDLPAATFWMRVGRMVATATPAANVGGASVPRSPTATPPSRGTEAAPPLALGPEKTMTTSTGIELVWIPPGEFLMGSTTKEREWAMGPEGKVGPKYLFESGEPKRTAIKDGFWLGRTEVTVGQWQKFADATAYITDGEKRGNAQAPNPKTGQWGMVQGASWRNPNFGFPLKDNHPVCCISWNDAVAFCEWLTETEKKAGKLPRGMVYRLPGEAEWEYACRGGREGAKFWWGDTMEKGKGRLNASGGSWEAKYKYVSPADAFGSRGRNGFGLADMLANISEWCLDGFDAEAAHAEPYKERTNERVFRSGSFHSEPGHNRCASRYRNPPSSSSANVGFRVCAGVAW